jgi:hypothetical protein
MVKKKFFIIVISLTTGIIASFSISAAHSQVIGDAWKLCDSQTRKEEKKNGIPRYLLKSISLAETSRWNSSKQANVAWPWTVTALGVGNYFNSKAEALEYVRFLKSNAITNIDVGCMQVNLYYHGGAFASLEDAIDPSNNVSYAARFLKSLYQSERSWTKAAGFYHSKTPKHYKSYKLKILKHWEEQRQLAGGKDLKVTTHQHMAKLNAYHTEKRQNTLDNTYAIIHNNQIAAWRNSNGKTHNMATLAKMQRAYMSAQWKKKYAHNRLNKTSINFADKRRKQLNKWRLTRERPNNG